MSLGAQVVLEPFRRVSPYAIYVVLLLTILSVIGWIPGLIATLNELDGK